MGQSYGNVNILRGSLRTKSGDPNGFLYGRERKTNRSEMVLVCVSGWNDSILI